MKLLLLIIKMLCDTFFSFLLSLSGLNVTLVSLLTLTFSD